MKGVYESPEVANRLEQEKERAKLLQMIDDLKRELEKLTARNK